MTEVDILAEEEEENETMSDLDKEEENEINEAGEKHDESNDEAEILDYAENIDNARKSTS